MPADQFALTAAGGAGVDLPAQGLGAALLDGAHRLPVTGQDLI